MIYNIGDKFGYLTIVSFYEEVSSSGRIRRMAECVCDCGSVSGYEKYNLGTGNSTKCYLCAKESRAQLKKTHGHSMSRKDIDPEGYNCYTRWQSMKRRCNNPSDKRYFDYGGRGIKVCDRWQNSYENFLLDMGLPPSRDYQIDRIYNLGDYEPSNCRWVSSTVNGRNKRNNKLISAFGETLTQAEWAEKTGIKRETIAMRIKRGWEPEKALSK